jgi:hypothetical protein
MEDRKNTAPLSLLFKKSNDRKMKGRKMFCRFSLRHSQRFLIILDTHISVLHFSVMTK